MALVIPVLCYHAHIIGSNDYAGNAHIALAEDLQLIQASGRRIVPLRWIVDWLQGRREDADMINAVGISFDDGTLLDFQPVEHPQYGTLPGLLPILQRFARQHQYEQPSVHASCFVIASPLARMQADQHLLYGRNWLASDWWPDATASGLMSIENHSWDHNMAVATEACATPRNSFRGVDDLAAARRQIEPASELIEELSGRRPELFAYPYGDVNDYLADCYLPEHGATAGLRAAFTTAGKHIDAHSDRWQLPRYVHGLHWRQAQQLQNILRQS